MSGLLALQMYSNARKKITVDIIMTISLMVHLPTKHKTKIKAMERAR
jgi:hypothetical protein